MAKRRKGYTKHLKSRKEMQARKPPSTVIRGCVGRVRKLFLKLDLALQERDWNWAALAEKIPCSRQYLMDLTEQEEINEAVFRRICSILELDADDLIEPMKRGKRGTRSTQKKQAKKTKPKP